MVRKGEKMDKKNKYAAVLFLAGALSFSLFSEFAPAAEDPLISHFFAAQELVSGETWKIYLKASSSAADMKYIYATVEQKGGTIYPVSLTRIKKGDERSLSGYLRLHTASAGNDWNVFTLDLTIQIKDERGRFSNPVIFPLKFNWRASKQEPPAGVFEERDLGPIMIQLRPLQDAGDSSYSP